MASPSRMVAIPDVGSNFREGTASKGNNTVLSGRIVTLFVGRSRRKWIVHEKLLTQLSDFFKATFRPDFKEGREGELYLPEDEERAFELLMGYAYGTLDKLHQKSLSPPDGKKLTISDYLHLYVLAHMYMIYTLQNAVIDVVHDYCCNDNNQINPEAVRYIYKHTPRDNQMRQLLLWKMVHTITRTKSYASPAWVEVLQKDMEISSDIILQIWRIRSTKHSLENILIPWKPTLHVPTSDATARGFSIVLMT